MTSARYGAVSRSLILKLTLASGATALGSVMGMLRILHLMYRELSRDDGFIVTAYIKTSLDKTKAIWPRG